MRAVRVHHFGPPENIVIEDLPTPIPGAAEVLVKVRATGVGSSDARARAGISGVPLTLPLTLGSDLAGTIVAIGSGVAEPAVGEEIYGVTNPRFTGANAQYALACSNMIARKPRNLSFIEAASVPRIAVTASQMLFELARVERGKSVLIHGALGNVGGFAAQLARYTGARVFATGDLGDAREMADLGVDQVIDLARTSLSRFTGTMDAVIDAAGGDAQRQLFPLIKRGGILVSLVSSANENLARQFGVRSMPYVANITTGDLVGIADLLQRRQLITRVGRVLPLEQARRAHQMLEDGEVLRGKIVLEVDEA